MNRFSKIVFLFSIIFFIALMPKITTAQPPDPVDCVDEFGNPLPPDDPRCPIDGGLAIFIATGAGLGLLRKKKKP
jgi:hypothetical protein